MATINQLSTASTVSTGDQIAIYSASNGDARKASINALLSLFQASFSSPSVSTSVQVPATGFSIAVGSPVSEQQWIILQPVGTLASGTITLPLNTGTPDGTEVMVTTTKAITSFTLALNGATAAYGAPTALTANQSFRMRFVQSTNSWYPVT